MLVRAEVSFQGIGNWRIEAGEILQVLDDTDPEWWFLINSNGDTGNAPSSYFTCIAEDEDRPNLENDTVIAVSEYLSQDIFFGVGEELILIDDSDPEHWLVHKSDGTDAFVPSSYFRLPNTPTLNFDVNPTPFDRLSMASAAETQEVDDEDMPRCSMCEVYLEGDIYQCETGHSVCSECKASGRVCTTCSMPITGMRNFVLQEIIMGRKKKCINFRDGCNANLPKDEMQKHIHKCTYNFKDLCCPVVVNGGQCPWMGDVKELKDHVLGSHPKELLKGSAFGKDLRIPITENDRYYVHHLTSDGNHFLVHMKINSAELQVVFQVLGARRDAKPWLLEVAVSGGEDVAAQLIDNCHTAGLAPLKCFSEQDCSGLMLQKYSALDMLCYKMHLRPAGVDVF